jgi:hypothetical protein
VSAATSRHSASESVTSSAFAFCSSCATLVAPRIALETTGSRSNQAMATAAGSRPRLAHQAPSRSAAATLSGEIAFCDSRKCANGPAARLPSGRAPAAYLLVSTPCASGE